MIHHRWMVPWWVWYRFGACVRLFGRWYGYNKNIKNTLRHKQVTLYFKKLKRPEKKLSNSTQFQLISLQMFVEIKTKPVKWPACYYQHSCFSGLNKSPVIRLFFKELNTIQSPHQNQPSTFWIHFLHNFTGLVKMTSGETDLQVRKAKHMTEYFAVKLIVNIPLINREWDHYRKISDRGLDVLT